MKASLQRALAALITFAIGVAAAAFWYGYYQRARTARLSAVGVASASPVPLAGIRVSDEQPPSAEAQTNPSDRQSKYLRAIEFVRQEVKGQSRMQLANTAAEKIDVDLELADRIGNQLLDWGDDSENQLIILRPAVAAKASEFKIEEQFETSFQVYGEGPHVDLTDWKHYRSRWSELKRMGDSTFVAPKISGAEASRFPNVTGQEIYSAVLNAGGSRWASEARRCRSLTSAPCNVGVSTVSFRISVKEKGRWKIINRINFAIPMGC